MRIAYANGFYREGVFTGGNAHVQQFFTNAVGLGHEVWTWPGDQHPATRRMPRSRVARILKLRSMDAVYVRVDYSLPWACRWAAAPYRQLLGSPVMVWEFNTVPEFGFVMAKSEADVRRSIQGFQFYGRGCDLAICVSDALAKYVRERLGIESVLVVPNGSNPDLFRPDVSPVKRVQRNPDRLNVIWMGSANLAWHNFDLLRKAAEMLWRCGKGSRVVFHILGNGLSQMRVSTGKIMRSIKCVCVGYAHHSLRILSQLMAARLPTAAGR